MRINQAEGGVASFLLGDLSGIASVHTVSCAASLLS